MSIRLALIVLQILTISAQIYALHRYKAKIVHCCAECPGFHGSDGIEELDRIEKKIEGHV